MKSYSAQLLTLLGVVLGAVGVSVSTSTTVQAIAAAAIPVLIGLYQWQVHRTKRQTNTLAAQLATAKVQTSTATTVLAGRVAAAEQRISSLEAAQAPPLVGSAPSAAQTPAPEHPAPSTGAINGGTG